MAFGDPYREVIQPGAIKEKQDVPLVDESGESIGRAVVWPDGEVIAHLNEDTYRGKMWAGVIKRQAVDHITLVPTFKTKGNTYGKE